MTNTSILKFAGAFHGRNTSRIRFWAFSYSIGDPCERSNQLIMYFIHILLDQVDSLRSGPCLELLTTWRFGGAGAPAAAGAGWPADHQRSLRIDARSCPCSAGPAVNCGSVSVMSNHAAFDPTQK